MPVEGNMFNNIDKLWKDTMDGINTDNTIMDLSDRDNIKGLFEEANKNLEKI
jgi:hypothetical protein